MLPSSPEHDFRRFCSAGDTAALGRVFERLAPELLLVAAHLAGGDTAEDLVQATFLDAIGQRARWDQRRPLAPWLVGILANHVLRARRERTRVPDPHRLPSKDSESPHAEAEAREIAELVRGAVEALPLGYRQALSLRLVHGLDLQQISGALGMPLGTVKTRLHRGMVLLRRALSASLASALAIVLLPGRGLAAMREVILSHAATAVPAATAGIVLGALTMKKAVLITGVVALTLGAFLATATWPRGDLQPGPAASSQLQAPGPAAVPAVVSQQAIPDPVQAAGTDAPVRRESVLTAGSLQVDVAWSDGSPAAGVGLVSWSRNQKIERLQPTSTDARGQATYAELAPGEYAVAVSPRARHQETRVQVEAGSTTRCRLAIVDELQLEVQVVDAGEHPQAGADVWGIVPDGLAGPLHQLGRTADNGILVHRCLALSRIWARKAGHQPSLPTLHALLQNDQGETRSGRVQVRLVLGAPGCQLEGQVVDPRGHPAAGATVVIAQDESLPKQPFSHDQRAVGIRIAADDAGHFRCDEVGPGDHAIQAVAPGFAPAAARVTLQNTEPATVLLQLGIGAVLQGRIVHRDGSPIPGARIDVAPFRSAFGFETYYSELCRRQALTDADGRYRLAALRPGEAVVSASAEADDSRRRMDLAEGATAEWNVTLPEGGAATGTVVDPDGKGLSGWIVIATGGGQYFNTQRHTNTRPDGGFTLEGLPDAKLRLAAFDPRAKGAATAIPRAVLEDVRPPADGLVLRVASLAGGSIAGQISWPEGAAHEKVTLSVYSKERTPVAGTEHLPAGTDAFHIGPLPPGDYDLMCYVEGRASMSLRGLHVLADQTVAADFHLEEQQSLRLRLHLADGRPVHAADVKIVNDFNIMPCRETAAGDYLSPPASPGSYTVKVRGPDVAPFQALAELTGTVVERTLPAGAPIVFRFRPAGKAPERWVGALSVKVKDAQGGELVQDLLQIDGSDHFDWCLGLVPGSYTLTASEFTTNAQRMLQLTVSPAAAEPQMVEVQLERR